MVAELEQKLTNQLRDCLAAALEAGLTFDEIHRILAVETAHFLTAKKISAKADP